MKERPIIFDARSVQRILEGHKTMTRRVIKPQPHEGARPVFQSTVSPHWGFASNAMHAQRIRCPHGMVGDHLWVRETWAAEDLFRYDQTEKRWIDTGELSIQYRATEAPKARGRRVPRPAGFTLRSPTQGAVGDADGVWRSPIHMPRWASRILLEITRVRVERLHDLRMGEAALEGIVTEGGHWQERKWFMARWDEINAKRGYPWESNPWVWVVSFKVVENE